MKKVSVVMASFLGQYPGRAINAEKKIIRAIKSFLTQTYKDKELILVSDGCTITEQLYNNTFKKFPNIKYVNIPNKQALFSGEVRNLGIGISNGEYICYLDVDDVWGKTHLETIMSQVDDYDFVYYDDFLVKSNDFKKLQKRNVEPRIGCIGSSSIAHKKLDWLKWKDGIGHEWQFIMTAIIKGVKFKKLEKTPQYLIGHWHDKQTNERGDF